MSELAFAGFQAGVHPNIRSGARADTRTDVRPQFRLRPGRDDAVIAWLASMQPRQRSIAIRDALWHYLTVERSHSGSRRPKEDQSEDPTLAAALDALF